ncbi:hypothetical protein [Streptomyces sp. NPDC002676]
MAHARPAVAVFGEVIRVTDRQWSAGDDVSPEAIRAPTESYLGQAGPALTGNRRSTGDHP